MQDIWSSRNTLGVALFSGVRIYREVDYFVMQKPQQIAWRFFSLFGDSCRSYTGSCEIQKRSHEKRSFKFYSLFLQTESIP